MSPTTPRTSWTRYEELADTISRYECDNCGRIATEAEMLPGDYFDEELGADLNTKYVCPHRKTMNFSRDPGHGWGVIGRLV